MDNNRISRQLADYLAYKRSLGFKLTHEATVLNRFAEYTGPSMHMDFWQADPATL